MMITKRTLPRRTFLRGTGAAVALPLLDAMVPPLTALSRTAAAPVRRLGCVYIPNGIIYGAWTPRTVGAGLELSETLSPLAAVRDQVTVISGLAHLEANTKGDGSGDHARATAVWLTGVHAWTGTGRETRLDTSLDQIVARELGEDTPLRSLELGLEYAQQGTCDSGDCFYSNTVSWRNPTTPLPVEAHPRVVFERLFGDGGTKAQRLGQIRKTGSILDSIGREVASLERSLGSSDRGKLTEYLAAVRDVERRIQATEHYEAASPQSVLPDRPVDIPESYEEHAQLMFDLMTLAYQSNLTRIFTMMMGRESSSQAFPQIGIPEQHHSISHHLNNPTLMAKKARIDQYFVSQLAYFLERLRATPDGDGSLLDHSLILYGSGMGNGNLHEHTNMPCLLAGGAGGQVKGGRHLQYPENTPMANLLLTMLDKLGVPAPEKIGDSTEHLSGL